jgi:hypothetical protein
MADTTRRWVMIGTLALTGATAGGVAGYILAPELTGVVASLAVAGFGLGGALGTLFAGGWRSPPKPEPAPAPPPEPEPEPAPEPEPEPEPEPPPPDDREPGWHPLADGTRRYWNGTAWTAHVWRERRAKSAPAGLRGTASRRRRRGSDR